MRTSESERKNLCLGFTTNIKLFDTQRKGTSNTTAKTPWDTVATRFKNIIVLPENFPDGYT